MAFNKWVDWGFSTLALMFLNKRGKSSSGTSAKAATLSVTQTRLGNPIPVVLGQCLVKSPLIAYYGDFSSKPYTETYAAHANFNAWPLVFALIAEVMASPSTGTTKNKGQVTSGKESGASVESAGTTKDTKITPLIKALFLWLLNWLINGRNLKTTIQKGFKYYLGFQEIICWSSDTIRLKAVYMNEEKVWEGDEGIENHLDGSPFIISVNDENLFGGPDENGGFVGELHFYFGTPNQQPDKWMVQQMNAASIQPELRGYTPAYQQCLSLVVPTAYIGKQATIPTIWVEVENVPYGLELGKIGNDANPAEILYELHTNSKWGLAEKATDINLEQLKKVGQTLAGERLGLSLQLTSRMTAKSLICDINNHLSMFSYLDAETGKLTYKLIRQDYTDEDCLEINVSNCNRLDFVRQSWSNTISSVSVSYTDRANMYETSTLSSDDTANIEINDGIKT